MTWTDSWRQLTDWIKEQEQLETELLKSEDNTRKMIHRQEATRIFPLIIEKSREIVDELDRIISSAPAYASGEMKKRASWDLGNARVEFRIVPDLSPEVEQAINE